MSFCFESMGSVIGRLPTHGPTLGLRMWRKSAVECCLMADQVIRHRCRRDRAAVGGEVVLFIVFPTHTDIVFGVGGNLIRQPPMGWPEKAAIMGRGGGGGGGGGEEANIQSIALPTDRARSLIRRPLHGRPITAAFSRPLLIGSRRCLGLPLPDARQSRHRRQRVRATGVQPTPHHLPSDKP